LPNLSDRIIVVGVKPRSLLNFRGELLKALINRGYRVIACSSPANEEIVTELQNMGVEHKEICFQRAGINPFKDIRVLFRLRDLLKRFQPDKVLLYTVKPVIYGSLAARGLDIEVYSLITGAGYSFSSSGIKQSLISLLVKRMYRLSLAINSSVIFQNPDDLRLFSDLKLLNSQIECECVNGSGVDTQYFHPVPLPDEPVFLLIARLLKDKGIKEYVGAAREIRKYYPESRFLLLGDFDPSPGAISEEHIKGWNEEGIIEYWGTVEDVRPVLSQARFYVLPSYYREGVPRTVLEAMSMGRPIITTDAPGCRETVVKEENGLLVTPKDEKSLATAMLDLLNNPLKTENMGKASRKRAVESFDVHEVNRHMLRIMGIE